MTLDNMRSNGVRTLAACCLGRAEALSAPAKFHRGEHEKTAGVNRRPSFELSAFSHTLGLDAGANRMVSLRADERDSSRHRHSSRHSRKDNRIRRSQNQNRQIRLREIRHHGSLRDDGRQRTLRMAKPSQLPLLRTGR